MNDEMIPTKPKPFVFVLMPFDKELDDTYKFGIKDAAKDAECYAERLDEQIFEEGMLERIFNQISKADVIVADMTGRNPNVFYEVGYAHALNKIVLLLTQKKEDIPFDLQHRQHIIYAGSIKTLKNELTEKLKWAVKESKTREVTVESERFTVYIETEELIEGFYNDKAKTFSISLKSGEEFNIPFLIRNLGQETTPILTHLYILGTRNSPIIPCEYREVTLLSPFLAPFGTLGMSRLSKHEKSQQPSLPMKPMPIKPIQAEATDSLKDGLDLQYRLAYNLPPLPLGAAETLDVVFNVDNKTTKPTTIKELFKLRIHSRSRYYDFPFNLKVELIDDPKSTPIDELTLDEPRE